MRIFLEKMCIYTKTNDKTEFIGVGFPFGVKENVSNKNRSSGKAPVVVILLVAMKRAFVVNIFYCGAGYCIVQYLTVRLHTLDFLFADELKIWHIILEPPFVEIV